MKSFPRIMQDRTFVSWHMLGCTWSLRLPKKVHRSMIFGKNMTIFVKSSLFSRKLCYKFLSNNQTQFKCQITDNDCLIYGHIKSIDIPSFGVKKNVFFVKNEKHIVAKDFHGTRTIVSRYMVGHIWCLRLPKKNNHRSVMFL